MKIPDKIKIGGHWWKIEYPYVFKERMDIWGQCDSALKTIRISNIDGAGNIRPQSADLVTLIHEILHAIGFLSNDKTLTKHDANEEMDRIEFISEMIYQVLIDNGWLEIEE